MTSLWPSDDKPHWLSKMSSKQTVIYVVNPPVSSFVPGSRHTNHNAECVFMKMFGVVLNMRVNNNKACVSV